MVSSFLLGLGGDSGRRATVIEMAMSFGQGKPTTGLGGVPSSGMHERHADPAASSLKLHISGALAAVSTPLAPDLKGSVENKPLVDGSCMQVCSSFMAAGSSATSGCSISDCWML